MPAHSLGLAENPNCGAWIGQLWTFIKPYEQQQPHAHYSSNKAFALTFINAHLKWATISKQCTCNPAENDFVVLCMLLNMEKMLY